MRTPAALVLTALLLAGCGGSGSPSEQEQVRNAIRDYVKAVGGDNPGRMCDLIVRPDGRRPPSNCRERVERGSLAPLGDVRVGAVSVKGARATARVGTEPVNLLRVDGTWRIVVPG